MMKVDKILFPSITWWLLLLVPFVFFGFYPTYFSKLFSPIKSIFHIHAFFMGLWIMFAIFQPFLISRKKIKMHRRIGKLSYFIMPLVLVTGWMVIRQAYYDRLERDAIETVQKDIIIGIVYLAWLAVFYLLAVINRRRIVSHATYMFAAILTLLGPTLDRILFHIYQYFGIGFNFFAEVAVFALIDLLLMGLLWYQWRKGYSLNAIVGALSIYIGGQLIFFFLPKTGAWKSFVSFIM